MNRIAHILTLIVVFCLCFEGFSQEMPRKIKALGLDITLDNEARYIIAKEIDNLSYNRKYLDAMLVKMALYLPLIERELAAEEVPDEFKFLCVQESALNAEAISSSNAVGFWQFKHDTGAEVGLAINSQVDERKHIVASTRGAAIYLTRNNLIMKNWLATLLSHRLGLNGAKAVIPQEWYDASAINVKGQDDWYILRFLAYQYVLAREYNMFQKTENVLYEYKLGRGKPLKQIAADLNVPFEELKAYNPWLLSADIPNDKDYSLLVLTQKQKTDNFDTKVAQRKATTAPVASENFDNGFPELKLVTENAKEGQALLYEINGKKGVMAIAGDTPAIIANRADISLRRFLKFNDLEDDKIPIIAGKVYYLKKKDKKAKVVYHVVKDGETLWDISQTYGIRLEYLMEKNRIETVQRLQKGRLMWLMETRPENTSVEYVLPPQRTTPEKEKPKKNEPIILTHEIKTPKEEPTKPVIKDTITTTVFEPKFPKEVEPLLEMKKGVVSTNKSSASITHTVEHGETFFSIATKYGLNVAELREINGMGNNEGLISGQTLKVSRDNSDLSASASTEKPQRTIIDHEEKLTPAPETKPKQSNLQVTYYVVKTGETAFRVSIINGVSVDDLARWNNLKNYNVFVGQRLVIKK